MDENEEGVLRLLIREMREMREALGVMSASLQLLVGPERRAPGEVVDLPKRPGGDGA